jgi:hypothetical protein
VDVLVQIWNDRNDIPSLILQETAKIEAATEQRKQLKILMRSRAAEKRRTTKTKII